MTNDAPRTIWADSPQVFDDCDVWHSEPAEGRTEYIRADIAQAEKEAAVQTAMAASYDLCVKLIESLFPDNSDDDIVCRVAADSIRSLSKVSRARAGTDALAARDARVRAEALREAAGCATANMETLALKAYDVGYNSACADAEEAILALIPSSPTDQEENSE